MTILLALCMCFPLLTPPYGLETDLTSVKTDEGAILYPKEEISGNKQAIKIQVITDEIIWVIAPPKKTRSVTSSPVYIYDASSWPTRDILPFLISKNNCHILRDKYFITKVGGTRTYKSLSAIKLFSKNDQPGWFTTTYCNGKSKAGEILIQRAELEIKMEYIDESAVNVSKKEGIMITCNGEKQIVHLK